jgi:uncharacterized membrane protein (UPF0127 family)
VRYALLLTLSIACSTSGKHEDSAPMPQPQNHAPYTGPKVFVTGAKGDVQVNVEVVATAPKIQKGLMFRQHLPLDAGMLFLMGRENVWDFWMRNTLIPLDMLFIAADMKVAGIVENAEPLTEDLRTVGKPSLYVLEVNGGWAKENGVVAGAQVRFVDVPKPQNAQERYGFGGLPDPDAGSSGSSAGISTVTFTLISDWPTVAFAQNAGSESLWRPM